MTDTDRLFLFCTLLSLGMVLHAEVTLDGSLGPAGAIKLNTDNTYAIDSSVGKLVGSNLFHSFGRFNLEIGTIAHFTDSTESAIANVIARVTDGTPSSIDGTIKSSIADANLYLINPAGMLFGPNAQIDIPGSFHASTASAVTFQDGGRFDAVQPGNDVLTAAPPQAFGFLDSSTANNGIDIQGAWLFVNSGEKLDISAPKINIDNSAALFAPGGEIRLVAMQGAGEVSLQQNADGALPLPEQTPSIAQAGDISLLGNSAVDYGGISSSGDGGGRIAVWGSQVVLKDGLVNAINSGDKDANVSQGVEIRSNTLSVDDVWIQSDAYGAGKAGDIRVTSTGSVDIVNAGQLSTQNSGAGQAGAISLKAGAVHIDRQDSEYLTGIQSVVSGSGDAGDVLVESTGDMDIVNGGEINSATLGEGKAAAVTIKAGALILDKQDSQNNTSIVSLTSDHSTGQAGIVMVDSVGAVEILNGAFITSTTQNASDSASVTIKAGSLKIQGHDINNSGSAVFTLASAGSTGQGGSIDINTRGGMAVLDGGIINSDTQGVGKAGDINITSDVLTIQGADNGVTSGIFSSAKPDSSGASGDVSLEVDNAMNILSGGIIDTSTFSSGGAGKVSIAAGQLTMDRQNALDLDGSPLLTGVLSRSYGVGSGKGGDVSLKIRDQLAIMGSQVTTSTLGTGQAGMIDVDAGNVVLTNEGSMSAATFGTADGGSINISSHNLSLTGESSIYSRTNAESGGKAGDVSLSVDGLLSITNASTISSASAGSGNAGSVTVNSGRIVIDKQASNLFTGISSAALYPNSGRGGDVNLTIRDDLLLSGGSISASSAGSYNAGSIGVTADKLVITGGLINAITFGAGDAGDIRINADTLKIDGQNQVFTGIDSASFGSGAAGNIGITANNILLSRLGSITTDTFVSGSAGEINLSVNHLSLNNGGHITSSTQSSGDAGDIVIQGMDRVSPTDEVLIDGLADNIDFILPDGHVAKGSPSGIYLNTIGSGNGGSLDLQTNRLAISDGGLISAVAAFGSSITTKGGDIDIHAHTVDLSGGALISANTSGVGKAGSVKVEADKSLTISGYFDRSRHTNVTNPRTSERSGISSGATYDLDPNAEALGRGGKVTVSTSKLILADGAEISAVNKGSDEAGTIYIAATDTLILRNDSAITVESALGSAGDVNINVGNLVYLLNSKITTSAAAGFGNGGNINIDPTFVVLNNSRIIADALKGNGGNINITTDFFLPSASSIVSASSKFGLQGVISIQSQYSNIVSSIGVLPSSLLDVSNLLNDDCSAAAVNASSFTVNGRGSLPLAPDSFLFQGLQSMQCGVGL